MVPMLGAAISSRCGSKRKHFCIVDVFFFIFLKQCGGGGAIKASAKGKF